MRCDVRWHYHFFLALPAFEREIAIACLVGLPSFFNRRMFVATVLLEEPFLSGMAIFLKEKSGLSASPAGFRFFCGHCLVQ